MRHESGPDAGVRTESAGPGAKVVSLLSEGLAAFCREDEELALDCFLDILDLQPDNLRAAFLAALAAALVSDEEALERACGHAREVNPRHPYTLAAEGSRYLFLANFSRAEDLFQAALRARPAEIELQLGLAVVYSQSGDDAKGNEVFGRVLEADPENVRARLAQGMALAQNGDFSAALSEYQRAKQADPEVENPHQRLGRDYYAEGMFAEAASEFAAATSEEPDQPAAWFYLMDCYARRELCDDALDIYETIQEKFRDRPDLTSGLFEFFHFKNEAVGALEELSRRHPDDADVAYRLSVAYGEAGRSDGARRLAEQAVRLDPESHRLHSWLAEIYFRAGRYADTVAACDRAIKLFPPAQTAYMLKSDALLYLGRGEESEAAVAAMEQARERAWENYQARFSGKDLSAGSDS